MKVYNQTSERIRSDSFKEFLYKNSGNRNYLLMALITSVLSWWCFKFLYPYPCLVFDSYSYIRVAVLHLEVDTWPTGYSKFLSGFSKLSHSPVILVTFQYYFLVIAQLTFFFTWLYLFNPSKLIARSIFTFLLFNPLFLYCSNFILSDSIFISLSLLWLTQLIWIVIKSNKILVPLQALTLVIAFSIRYNALYYPAIAIIALAISSLKLQWKIGGISLTIALFLLFILHTQQQVASLTGQRQFSPFGGWKIANDALYVYSNIPPAQLKPVPKQFRSLDSIVRTYFQTTDDPADSKKPDYTSGSYYMFNNRSPLVQYLSFKYPGWGNKEWAMVSPEFQSYGTFLITTYPAKFIKHFVYPNLQRYAIPPGEVFGSWKPFIWHEQYGGAFVRQLFGLDTIITKASSVQLSIWVLNVYPLIFTLIHACFLTGMLGFALAKGHRTISRGQLKAISLIGCLWICDFIFSTLSAGIVIRYQIFISMIELSFGLHLLAHVYTRLKNIELLINEA